MSIHLVVLGGFLGSGKTTTLLRLAQHWTARGKRVAIVTNDQAETLVDTESFRAAGLRAAEVAGGCFCCRFDDFIARADELSADVHPDVILAEPVGSCTDIVATVIHPLRRMYEERFTVAPYAVAVDPVRALAVLGRTERVGLSERVTYIYRMQQQEADAIAINKIDLLTAADRQRVDALVREQFPGRAVLMYSARTGEGFDAFAERLDRRGRPGEALPDIDYDRYAEGEAALGWLNGWVRLTGEAPIALDDAALEFGRDLHAVFESRHLEVAHGKVLLSSDDDKAVVNILGGETPPQLSRRAGTDAADVQLTVNLRVEAEPRVLDEAFHGVVSAWADRLRLTVVGGSGQTFKPSRPVPTHRLTD